MYGGCAVARVLAAHAWRIDASWHPADVELALSVVSLLAWLFLVLSYVLSTQPDRFTAAVKVSPGTIEGSVLEVHAAFRSFVVRRADIAGALVVPRRDGGKRSLTAEFELVGGERLAVYATDLDSATKLVAAARGRSATRNQVRLARPSRRLLHLPLAIGAMLLGKVSVHATAQLAHADGNAVALVIALLVYWVAREWLLPAPEFVVGVDGVRVRKSFGRSEVLPHARVSSAIRGLLIDSERADAVVRTVRGMMDEGGLPRPAAHLTLAGLRHAPQEPFAGYRSPAAGPERAAEAILGTTTNPLARVEAAVVLRANGYEVSMIRVAADAMVDRQTQEALEAVAADDDVGIERALRALARSKQ